MRCGSAPLQHEVRDAVRERVGLAGAGAGDDQQRAVCVRVAATRVHAVLDREPLLRVERREEGFGAHGSGTRIERSFYASDTMV